MSNKNTSKNVWLHIMGVLILVELVVGFITMSTDHLFRDITKLIPLVFIALYGFALYKKPHGNMLKYAMLLLAVMQILSAIQCIKIGWDGMYLQTARVFIAAILIYVSGRLNRIEQNKVLLAIAAIAQIVHTILQILTVPADLTTVYLLTWSSGAVSILTLMIAYFTRYQEHKEAGLQDAPKK